ncbi:MAG: helix-turn-helix transcriptional regulator [Candidatus Paceibacterota bacterium]
MEITNLKAYLCQINMTVKDFSKMIDYNPTYLSHILNGRVLAGHRLARDIDRATNGVVKLKAAPRKRDLKRMEAEKQQQESMSA